MSSHLPWLKTHSSLLLHAEDFLSLAVNGFSENSLARVSTPLVVLVEKQMLEVIERGKPTTGYMRFGDRVRIEMFDKRGRSIFGAIDQVVEPYRKVERREETKSRALEQWVITE